MPMSPQGGVGTAVPYTKKTVLEMGVTGGRGRDPRFKKKKKVKLIVQKRLWDAGTKKLKKKGV